MSAEYQAQGKQLVESLRHAIQEKRELLNGFAVRVDTSHLGTGVGRTD
jgi:hypothetical protein